MAFGLGWCNNNFEFISRQAILVFNDCIDSFYKDVVVKEYQEMPDLVVVDAGGRRLSLWR